MGYNPKTRFVISVDNIPRELLAIRELSNGDLIISFRPAQNHEGKDGNVAVEEDRLTVHRSRDSKLAGTTITHHHKFASGRYVQNAALVLNSQTELRWMPKFSWSIGLSNDRYAANIRDRDKVIDCGIFVPRLQSLFWGVLIERSGGLTPVDHHISFRSAEFEYFKVTLYFVFVLAPTIEAGRDLWCMTKLPRIDGEDHPASAYALGAPALEADQVFPLFNQALHVGLENYLQHLDKGPEISAAARNFITRGAHLVCPTPVADWDDLKQRIASQPDDFSPWDKMPNNVVFDVSY